MKSWSAKFTVVTAGFPLKLELVILSFLQLSLALQSLGSGFGRGGIEFQSGKYWGSWLVLWSWVNLNCPDMTGDYQAFKAKYRCSKSTDVHLTYAVLFKWPRLEQKRTVYTFACCGWGGIQAACTGWEASSFRHSCMPPSMIYGILDCWRLPSVANHPGLD